MQLNQAEAIKFAVENWRLRKFKTAGTIFWQWNDCWNVISWSAVDYRKRPKALYYLAKRFFNPILLVIKKFDDKVKIFVVNDLQNPVYGVLTINTFTTYGDKKFEQTFNLNIDKNSNVVVFEDEMQKLNLDDPTTDYVYAKLEIDGKKVAENSLFLTEPKFLRLNSPSLQFRLSKTGENSFILKIESKNLLKSVFIDFGGIDVKLSDNFFDVNPNSCVELTINSDKTLHQLLKSIKIKSLS